MMYKHGIKSKQFYSRAMEVMPNGVSSNYRFYSADETLVVAKAKGAHIYDFDGNRFVDYRLGWGPVIVGHGNEFVNNRVKEAIDDGVSFAATQKYEVSVCERIVDLCPGVEMVRLTNTGTEATMHAIRLARGHTGRDLILKFEGSYHGAHDNVMWTTQGADPGKVGNRRHPTPVKNSLGIPKVINDLILLCPWNDEEVLGDILAERGEEIATIIVEPILGNANALTPAKSYLQFLRDQCDKYGIVLIFDEVKTGFRIAPGGAREYFGVIPDISTYAKALGNGFPIAAIAGKKELLMELKSGAVFHGGTYSGNAASTAAADATLELIQSGEVFGKIRQVGRMIQDGVREICNRHSVAVYINGAPGMFGICFAEKQPRDWRELLAQGDWALSEKVYGYMVANGIMPEPRGMEPFFICAAHSTTDVEETLQRFEEGLTLALA
jgi:glutamate-1-semialdehyde 2,1-aminomutase